MCRPTRSVRPSRWLLRFARRIRTFTSHFLRATQLTRSPSGNANVSIVDTTSNTVIGDALISWDVYASTATGVTADQTNFDITIPEDLGGKCTTAGDCVIQWFWDAPEIDQTYEE